MEQLNIPWVEEHRARAKFAPIEAAVTSAIRDVPKQWDAMVASDPDHYRALERRSKASIWNDLMTAAVEGAVAAFGLIASRTRRRVSVITLDEETELRGKKLYGLNRRPSSTTINRHFLEPILPGLTLPTTLVYGYKTDRAGMRMTGTFLSCPLGREVLYSFPIEPAVPAQDTGRAEVIAPTDAKIKVDLSAKKPSKKKPAAGELEK